jgi:ATP-binding cassette, subfamily G (WHITE), member 2, PDR
VNGKPFDSSFRRKLVYSSAYMSAQAVPDFTACYVQQQDLHLETSTVREALRFSAVLRQPQSKALAQKYKDVEEIIEVCFQTSDGFTRYHL